MTVGRIQYQDLTLTSHEFWIEYIYLYIRRICVRKNTAHTSCSTTYDSPIAEYKKKIESKRRRRKKEKPLNNCAHRRQTPNGFQLIQFAIHKSNKISFRWEPYHRQDGTMAERIEAIKVTLNQSLNDKEKPWKKFFDLAEQKSGVPRVYLLAGEYRKLHIFFSFSLLLFVFLSLLFWKF